MFIAEGLKLAVAAFEGEVLQNGAFDEVVVTVTRQAWSGTGFQEFRVSFGDRHRTTRQGHQ